MPLLDESAFDAEAAWAGATPARVPQHWGGIRLDWLYTLLPSLTRRTACPERARDVLHEALLRVVTRTGAPIREPQAYLRRAIDAVLADSWHEASRWVGLPDDHAEDASHGTAPSAQHVAEVRERLLVVQRVLRVLPPKAREVFWLFRIEGWSHEEIAVRLHISRNMVERHVMRAMVDLRRVQLAAGTP